MKPPRMLMGCLLLGVLSTGSFAGLPAQEPMRVDPALPGPSVGDALTAGSASSGQAAYVVPSQAVAPVLGDPGSPVDARSASPQARFKVQDAYTKYLRDFASHAAANILARDVQDYYHAVGFNVPAAQTSLNEFDENETLTYSYDLGDVDGDHVDDLALDVFCVDYEGCEDRPGPCLLCVPPEIQLESEEWCGLPHRLFLVSGSNGTEIWRRDMAVRSTHVTVPDGVRDILLGDCYFEMVVGAAPSPDGGDTLLIYRYQVVSEVPDFLLWRTEHQFFLLDRLNGKHVWATQKYRPECDRFGCTNILVNPILQVPPKGGIDLVPKGTVPSLFFQGVGMKGDFQRMHTLPTETSPRDIIDDYQPIEWAARINLENGKEFWHENTFQPYELGPDTSVLPRALPEFIPAILTYVGRAGDLAITNLYYWNYIPCCFDLTGDRVPDMVYTTWEWNNKPSTNDKGPNALSSRLVAFDGMTGHKVWETYIENGTARYQVNEYNSGLGMYPYFELLGDANGDGVSDVLIHKIYYQYDYKNVIEVHDGKTGRLMWSTTNHRDNRLVVLGDGNKDGSNDILVVDWFNWEFPEPQHYDYVNATGKPLVLLSGRDGAPLWRAETFMAPTDLIMLVRNYRINGVPDLNGDGAGEFPADDPLMLPDLTTIHRLDFLDARNGKPLRKISTVGQFSVPAFAGNITGDSNHDLAILSGDITDLWVSIYDGGTGEGVWARRALTLKLSEYSTAMPLMRFHPLHNLAHGNDTVMNLQMEIVTHGGGFGVAAMYPQVAYFGGGNGSAPWAYPKFWDVNLSVVVKGPSPANYAWAKLLDEMGRPVGYAAATRENSSKVMAALASFVTAGLVCFGIGWRRKP